MTKQARVRGQVNAGGKHAEKNQQIRPGAVRKMVIYGIHRFKLNSRQIWCSLALLRCLSIVIVGLYALPNK